MPHHTAIWARKTAALWRRSRIWAVFLVMIATGCAAPLPPDTKGQAPILLDFPAMRSFSAAAGVPSTRSNAAIARDFLDLSFALESGRALPVMTRFEGPVTVSLDENAPAILRADLDGLLLRLRNEAGIAISTGPAATANITIALVTERAMRNVAPNAACFVVPRLRDWAQLRRNPNSELLDWTTLDQREQAAIFIPQDASPQEMRDCLHEELAQALGPLNDLSRLPDSVFNDDNMHAVLTGFDMIILAVTYAPQLRSGMTRAQVAAQLPALLARINPAGQNVAAAFAPDTPRSYTQALEIALGEGASLNRRVQAASAAVAIAQTARLSAAEQGFAHYANGRLQMRQNPALARSAFDRAAQIYASDPALAIHAAHVAVQQAAFALAANDPERLLALTQTAQATALRHENAALAAMIMMLRAQARDLQNQPTSAMSLRLDSLGWGLYGFGSRDAVIERLNDIAALPPATPRS